MLYEAHGGSVREFAMCKTKSLTLRLMNQVMASFWGRFVLILSCMLASHEVTARNISQYANNLLAESMTWMDSFYDLGAGYLYSTALTHETRASVWYASGLLARNNGSDADEAMKIIRNVVAGQYKDPSKQW